MRVSFKILAILVVLCFGWAPSLLAQKVSVPFGSVQHDTKLPVEIVSDSFTISQSRGSAAFVGNVVVSQGDLRISAGKISVEYTQKDGKPTGDIGRLIASGSVTLVSGTEAAEAQTATYSITEGLIIMEGNVLLTQGENALSGQIITIDLKDGSAKVEGRVKTIFNTGVSQ